MAIASPCVPFSAFALRLTVLTGPPPGFHLRGTFTTRAGGNGINPVTEPVTVRVGTFSTAIPPGSFAVNPIGHFVFHGVINGVRLIVAIVGGNHFRINAVGQGANLTGTVNPLTVGLTIGNDCGTAVITGF